MGLLVDNAPRQESHFQRYWQNEQNGKFTCEKVHTVATDQKLTAYAKGEGCIAWTTHEAKTKINQFYWINKSGYKDGKMLSEGAPITSCEKYGEHYYCASGSSVYKFTLDELGKKIEPKEIGVDIQKMCVMEDNRIVVLPKTAYPKSDNRIVVLPKTAYPKSVSDDIQLHIYDLSSTEEPLQSIKASPVTCDIAYSNRNIWVLKLSSLTPHTTNCYCKSTLTKISLDDDPKQSAELAKSYTRLETNGQTMLFWGENGCGMVDINQPLIDYSKFKERNVYKSYYHLKETNLVGAGICNGNIAVVESTQTTFYRPNGIATDPKPIHHVQAVQGEESGIVSWFNLSPSKDPRWPLLARGIKSDAEGIYTFNRRHVQRLSTY